MKQNCWQFKKCGRVRNKTLGVCPAVTELEADRINGGKNGGRICWAITGTCCNGGIQGTYAQKVIMCRDCDFRWKVQDEERGSFHHIFQKSRTA